MKVSIVIRCYNEIAKLRCRIFEVGISYYGRTYEEGKKSAGAIASQCCTHHQVWLSAMNAFKYAHDTDKLAAF